MVISTYFSSPTQTTERVTDATVNSNSDTLIQPQSVLSRASRIKFIEQSESSDCGLACIAMINQYFGLGISLNDIKQLNGTSARGTSLLELHDVMAELGYGVRGVEFDVSDIAELRLPAILHWSGNHFVVIDGVKGDVLSIIDPAIGRRQESIKRLQLGKLTALEILTPPSKTFVGSSSSNDKGPSLLTLIWTNKQMWPTIGWLAIGNVFFQLIMLAEPYLLSLVTDHAIATRDKNILELILYIFGGFFLAKIVLDFVNTRIQANLTFSFTASLYAAISKHTLSLPPLFFAKRSAVDLYSRISLLDSAAGFLGSGILTAPFQLIYVLGGIIILFMMAPFPAMVALSCLILTLALQIPSQLVLEKHQLTTTLVSLEETQLLANTLLRIEQIKLNCSEPYSLSRLYQKHIERGVAQRKLNIINDDISNISEAVMTAEKLVLIALLAIACIDGKLSVGLAIAFITLNSDVKGRALAVVKIWSGYRTIHVLLGRLHDICQQKPEFDPAIHKPFSSSKAPPAIELRNASFSYTRFGDTVLNDVNLRIEPNEKVLLVGESGMGKSTLLRLISTLYPPSSGLIFLNNHDVSSFNIQQVRKSFGGVFAEDRLSDGTIRFNLTGGSSHYDDEQIHKVLTCTNMLQAVEAMESGLNTLVTGDGKGVSTGQSQRLLVAGALLRQSPVLCLDEPTSHLDTYSAQVLGKSLLDYPGTVIVCTHDENLINLPFRIIRVDKLNQLGTVTK